MESAGGRLPFIYRSGRFLLRLYLGGLVRIRVENPQVPDTAFVISMNHRSALDMFLYVAVLRRRIKFMAKREVLHYPILGPIISRWCIPIARGRYDRRALDACVEALKNGFILSVFPEGTRHAGLAVAHGGAVVLASRAGVPVVPGAIMGRYRIFGQVTVRFGQPRHYPPSLTREARQEATAQLLDEIRALGAIPVAPPPHRQASGPSG